MDYQHEIAELTRQRGYRDGWTDEQFAARQVAKLVEEVGEAVDYLLFWDCLDRSIWQSMTFDVAHYARQHFDDMSCWDEVSVGNSVVDEAADCLVVLYNLADAMGFDLNKLALEKARTDVERGVRGDDIS